MPGQPHMSLEALAYLVNCTDTPGQCDNATPENCDEKTMFACPEACGKCFKPGRERQKAMIVSGYPTHWLATC